MSNNDVDKFKKKGFQHGFNRSDVIYSFVAYKLNSEYFCHIYIVYA